jgi:3-(3-hydroxy-phenyl)propionate hydroxylase
MKGFDLPPSMSGSDIQRFEFAYERSPDQDAATPVRHAVVVVGAGPVGLTLAIDLAERGQQVLLLDNDHRLSTGSRAICFAKRTLEIWDRLGVGDRMVAKGVSWNVGKVYFRDALLYSFDLLPEEGHERPAFINLQQYYAEAYLAQKAYSLPNVEIRWKNNVVALEQDRAGVTLGIDTPDGRYELVADHVVACDGSRSPLRALLGQESHGRVFRDRFLIADVRMKAPSPTPGCLKAGERPPGGQHSGEAASVGVDIFPAERWFWFDPPFHRNQSALLHMQPDGVWRIDFQLGWDADPEVEKKPEHIVPRVKALLEANAAARNGAAVPEFELEWASVYTFSCLRMDCFRHGRVLFAGDSAHGVSPFGARGANSGVQDAENIAWKLDLVLRGEATEALLDSYAIEREAAADENILNSTRATDFITPKSEISRLFRDAVLALAREHAFARKLVNSGRLSVPATLAASPLNTADVDTFEGGMVPGAPAADAPLSIEGGSTWLLRQLGSQFTLLVYGEAPAWAARVPVKTLALSEHHDVQRHLAKRYDLRAGSAYLFRPDQHVCARWRVPTEALVRAALARACALH